jgi:pimeloyl-ACP methyl ester carboxylesterase
MGGRAAEPQLSHHFIQTNGVSLHVVEAGPADGPLVILLHGFPEYWRSWRYQIPYLAAAGYRVWAVDLRGYNLSSRPKGIRAYSLDSAAADLIGLIHASGREKAFVVGHDFGGSVAWWAADQYPHYIERLVALNIPHPAVMLHNFFTAYQLPRSTYIFFFQLPWLPEYLLRLNHWQVMAGALAASARPGTFSPDDLAEYRRVWSRPGAITAMLNWYRAAVRYSPALPANPHITVPTLILWGAKDVALDRSLAEKSVAHCEDGRLIFFEEATHWIQHEEAARVNPLIAEFLI